MNVTYANAERLIEALGEPLAAHGRALLARVCRPWAARERLAPSRLAPDGSPLELAFSTSAHDVRVTAEPSLPDDRPAAKWRAAARVFAAEAEEPLLNVLRDAADQLFGCWISARCSAEAESTKLYQEVVPSMRALVLARMREAWPGIGDLKPMLVGVSEDGTMEFYAAIVGPGPRTLHRLFTAVGLPQLCPPAVRALGALAAREPRRLFDEVRLAVSLRPGVITLFAPANQLFNGDDGVARKSLLDTARRLGHDFTTYEAATRSLDRRIAGPAVHAMAGIAATAAGLHCWTGIRPFAVEGNH